jgi:hypothetical protein
MSRRELKWLALVWTAAALLVAAHISLNLHR